MVAEVQVERHAVLAGHAHHPPYNCDLGHCQHLNRRLSVDSRVLVHQLLLDVEMTCSINVTNINITYISILLTVS